MSFVRAFSIGLAALCSLVVALLVSVSPALAAEAPPAHPVAYWTLESRAAPTSLPLQGEGKIAVTAANLGSAEVDGEAQPVTIIDTLPAGLEVASIEPRGVLTPNENDLPQCSKASARQVLCTYAHQLRSYGQLEVVITVNVSVAGASELDNEVTVSGGETPSASLHRALAVNGDPTSFGVERYALTAESEDGLPDTQAGSHEFQLTTTLDLNQTLSVVSSGTYKGKVERTSPALAKNLQFKLPPGIIGNATVIPQCSDADFGQGKGGEIDGCPSDTAVGVATVTVDEPKHKLDFSETVPLFNLVPSSGEPAAFGFSVENSKVVLNTSVRTGEDYGVTVSVSNITQAIYFLGNRVTVWGVPGAASHDQSRGWTCLGKGEEQEQLENPCTQPALPQPPAFLTLPTSCGGPLSTSVAAEPWNEPRPAPPLSFVAGEPIQGMESCNQLSFGAEIKDAPDIQSASSPSGLTVSVHVPQEESLNPADPAAADVKDTTVTLPQGVTLNPAGANNLEACSEAQIGFEGVEPSGTDRFSSSEPSCPPASKIATATIHTPLLPNPLEGEVYLAAQNANPFGSLVAQYLVAKDPVSGVLVKLPGEVSLDPETGQITATFLNTPQLPFENLELHFFGGERAPLSTPAHCGTYTTNALFTPWSGNEAVSSTSSFEITSGPDGGPCPGASLPFAPSLAAGTANNQAGAFSTLDTTMGREDGNQNLQAIQLHFPPGLTGLLSHVQLCAEAQANAGTCGPESLIGHTTVSVGLGGDPYTVTGGEVFITGPYNGQGACTVGSPGCAPFGLSIVNPAVAGPYNLGKVVVRAKIEVDPHTAALTVTTNGSGAYAIPHILDGIPLQIKHVVVTIDRAGFTINPTDCGAMAITGTFSSSEGSSSPLSLPFQVTNCASLQFAPKFSVSTSGKTSKAQGASLTSKLSYPNAPQGTQADIAKVKVDLPKQLPSRLTTLQKACLAKVFEANPANCPEDSIVGHATVTTPLLPVSLNGPAYFVSHGGEAFPSLTMVLQGYGVTVDLVGTTFISKAGITSTTFKTVPDTPFNTFELILPEQKYSALAANGDLCTSKLAMPTAFVAQNGAEIHESTPISVTGCAKAKALTRAQKLTKALKACNKDVKKAKRASCKNRALKNYGSVEKKAKKKGGLSR
jgi:hypothetical protein